LSITEVAIVSIWRWALLVMGKVYKTGFPSLVYRSIFIVNQKNSNSTVFYSKPTRFLW
jgi:hypothetical protein